MKPNWEHAPEWANWLAMDYGGVWYWYAKQPELIDGGLWVTDCDAEWTLAAEADKPYCERKPK